MRIPDIKPLDWHSPEYSALLDLSHQTSLYVLPEWLELSKPLAFGAWFDESLVSAVFATTTTKPSPFIQYQGLLRTRREQPAIDRSLLIELERYAMVTVYNPPSLVDIAPFDWRFAEARQLWSADIRRTIFLTPAASPHPNLLDSALPEPRKIACDPNDFTDIAWTPDAWDALGKIAHFESVAAYEADGVVWIGSDRQGRGYLIAATGKHWEAMLWKLAQRFSSFDLGGANSKEMRRRARPFNGILRTCYAMRHLA